MLEINLLPLREARRRASIRQQGMHLVFGLVVTGGAIFLVHSRLVADVETLERRVAQMDHDIKQFQPQLDQVAKFRKKKSELEQKIEVIDGLDRARSGPVRVLHELSARTPDRLWLTKLDSKGDVITLKGSSLDNEIVAAFLRSLEESSLFQDVDLDGTKLGTKDDLKLVEFGIHVKLVGAPAAAKAAKGQKPQAKAPARPSDGEV